MCQEGTRVVAEASDLVAIGLLVGDYVGLDCVVSVRDKHDGQNGLFERVVVGADAEW